MLKYRFARPIQLYLAAVLFVAPLFTFASSDKSQLSTPHLTASLISEHNALVAGRSSWFALHFEIIPEWHTYWLNAGDSGNPPTIDWQLPAGFTASEIHWPYPERLPIGPLMNYGYSSQSTLLVKITPPDDLVMNKPLTLTANAEWLVCKIECIPEEGSLTLTMPVVSAAQQQASAKAHLIEQAQQRLPQTLPWPASLTVKENQLSLHVGINNITPQRVEDIYFYPARYGLVEHAAPQVVRFDENRLTLTLTRGDLRGQSLEQLNGVLLLSEHNADGTLTRAFDIHAPVATASTTSTALPMILLFALVGGLLLNIMPCVFPILSLKAMHIMQGAVHSAAVVRTNGIVFTAGVLISFAILAASLLALRAGGEALGWGFQLQSPVFVLALTWLLFAMGLMFSGVWSFGESWMGLGQRFTGDQGKRGAFFTGVLAVIVATPCTAPFMGTALGFALGQSTAIAMLVFVVLGLGMALPWLVLSLWPGLANRLPRPGPWMNTAKQVLAFPLYATSAWLLWVLSQQVNQPSLLLALLSVVFLGFLLWLWQQLRTRTTPVYKAVVALLLTLGLTGTLWQQQPANNSHPDSQANWQAFDPDRLAQLRAAGQPVLVNFTAAWCITCLVNEKVALDRPAVRAQLQQKGVVYMKADWTNKDPRITRILSRYERSGVPLYLLYPGKGQDAQVLPNILTESIVLSALQQVNEN